MTLPIPLTQACGRGRLLVWWAALPFPLAAHPPANRVLALNQWLAQAGGLLSLAVALPQLPPLPLLSLDPTDRVERAFAAAGTPLAVVSGRRDVPAQGRHTLLKLAGDLAGRSGLILSRAEVRDLQADPDKAYLLAEASRIVSEGALLLLGADPAGEDFRAWWGVVYPALGRPAAFALGEAIAWPEGVTSLAVDFAALAAELAALTSKIEPLTYDEGKRMKESVRIFISSTWLDLQPEREAVEKALHRLQEAEFSGMEYFGSRPETPKEASLMEVDRSDVYVGLFAHRYGSGITEEEYRRARERSLPCLIYIKDDTVPVLPAHIEREAEKITRLEALKKELREQQIVSSFTTPDQLATQVVTDLHNFLGRQKPVEKPAGTGATVIQNFAEKETPKMPPPTGSNQRCADLAENIRETLSLIKLYEERRRLSGDPKEKRRTEQEITDLRQQLAAYEVEARQLGCQ